MNELERQNHIIDNLLIKPISHGQVYTFQIAIPESQVVELSAERHENLRRSLTDQGTNLIPLIVRRTEAYSGEEEYEVVFGADWCLVAKEFNIEKLWVWVFDMTDEHAAATQAEIEQLVGSSKSDLGSDSDLDSLLEKKLKPVTAKLNKLISNSLDNPGNFLPNEKLGAIESRLENLIPIVEKLATQVEELTAQVKTLLPPPKLNLLQAEELDVNSALEGIGVKNPQRQAALESINYWKNSTKGLNWHNLEKSTRAGEYKIRGFARGTYEKLKEIADISN